MGKHNFYPEAVKQKAIEMKLSNRFSNQEIMDKLGIKNKSQIKTWMRWYKNEQTYRFSQPIGKQYSHGKGPKNLTEVEALKRENQHLKVQLEIQKKYREIERRWFQK